MDESEIREQARHDEHMANLRDAGRYRLLRRLHHDELIALANEATSDEDFDRRVDAKQHSSKGTENG